jgi:hypothetical protein
MTSAPIYEFAGLRIRSPLPLGARLSRGPHFDVEVVVDEAAPLPFERPSADVVAERRDSHFVYYTFCRVPGGVTARFFGLGEFFISESLDRVVCHCAPGMEMEYLSILLNGSIVAFLHAAQGRTVLHASAVRLGQRSIAVVGPSNQGKSTVAAILCAAGASLLTDDVLVVDSDPGPVVLARRGSCELRLRPGTEAIADRFSATTIRRPTVDQRMAFLPPAVSEARVPLSAIVFPRPVPESTEVHARRLRMGEAALLLGANQRIEGWRDAAVLRQQFQAVSDIVARVPVIDLTLPWGPPYAADLAAQIVHACTIATTDARELVL